MAKAPQIDVGRNGIIAITGGFYIENIIEVVGWITIGDDPRRPGSWPVTVPIAVARLGLDPRPHRAVYGDAICLFAA
jgi:hypothetical protein